MNQTKNKKLAKVFRAAGVAGAVILMLAIPAFAEGGNEVTTVLSNLVTMILDILRLIGALACIWGVVQLAMSFTSHDPSQRIQSVIFLAGGLILAFLKNVLTAIGVVV